MPVYIGKGYLHDRIDTHDRSKRKEKHWDHFSWFAIAQPEFLDDLEALMIRMLPSYLRILNQQRPKFARAGARANEADKRVEPPREFPRFVPEPKKRNKR